ncbi:MAG: alpha/beta fold hydrolase [Bryobacterales bacterium]|nr:alpha/beta fold hydrolase [Bryobacterales bacterium]
MNSHVAVFLPGIMGSVLQNDGRTIWPGELKDFVFGYRKLEELMADSVTATDILRSVSISKQYASLVGTLERCGFRENDGSLRTFAYDWRRSNAVSAMALADLLDTVGNAAITLIGHSMGGLIARHYLESGRFQHRPAFGRVQSLITLGTPHRGAPSALSAILGLERKVFLSASQVAQVARDPRFPAVYELLPPAVEPCFWNALPGSRYAPLDIYLPDISRALDLSDENLASAQAFHTSLDLSRRPNSVRYFFFSGSRMATTAGLFVDPRNPRNLNPGQSKAAGDGTVPIWSSVAGGVQSAFVGGEHSAIYKNGDLCRILAVLLGYQGTLDVRESVEVCVHQPVVEPGDYLSVSLSVGSGAATLEGELRMVWATEGGDMAVGGQRTVEATEQVHMAVEAPTMPGAYRVEFIDKKGKKMGEDEFFVQIPGE